jgi:hypothetical protein
VASSAPASPPTGARSTERRRASAGALPDEAEATGFTGFDPTAVALLAEIPDWDADQYSAHKEQLGTGLRKPGLALIEDVARRLDADLTVTSRSSISPLHRDLRFAPEGSPRYKDHLLLTTWEGADKRTAPTLWIRIDSATAGFASGIGFTPATRDRWRAAIGSDDGAALHAVLRRLARTHEIDIAGDEVKRVPAPFDTDHPRADLLRKTGFQVRFAEDLPDAIGDPSFADWCTDRLASLLPVHRWLTDHLT